MSIHDVREEYIGGLSDVKQTIRKDFDKACRELPTELKQEILKRCPMSAVKCFHKNKQFWMEKRKYDLETYGPRSRLYYMKGRKRIIVDPKENHDLNLSKCFRRDNNGLPIEVEISQFWTEITLSHSFDNGRTQRPYRTKSWHDVVKKIEDLTYQKYLRDWRIDNLMLGATPFFYPLTETVAEIRPGQPDLRRSTRNRKPVARLNL